MFAFTEPEFLSQIQFERHLVQRLLPHERGSHPRQFSLTRLVEPLVEHIGDDQIEQRIPHELEPLIVRYGMTAVGQRLGKQGWLLEPIAQTLLKLWRRAQGQRSGISERRRCCRRIGRGD